MNKKSSNQSNNKFRQQDSTVRKLESDIDTAAQKQSSQTANVIEEGSKGKSEGKLKKQFSNQTNHVGSEFRQQESTTNKIERTLDTQAQQQFTQTSNVISDSSNDSQGKLRNQSSPNDLSQSNSFKGSTHKSKLQKQVSNQAKEEFRQLESTSNKIERTLDTQGQQQFAQTNSVINDSSNDSQGKLRNQSSPNDLSQSNSFKGSTKKSKLQKQVSNQAKEEFRQLENTASKIDKVLNSTDQTKFTNDSKATSQSTNSSLNNGFQKKKNSTNKQRFKLQSKELAKGTLMATSSALKSGAEKYQGELENGDAEGVTLTSQGITNTTRITAKGIQKIRRKRLENKNFKKAKKDPFYKESSKQESSLKKIATAPATVLKNGVKNGAMQYKGQLEQEDEGVKLASQGSTQIVRASKKLTKGISKINAHKGKLGKQNSKLTQAKFNKSQKMKAESKTVLKKKAFKKKIYAPKRNKKAFTGVASSLSNRISGIVKNLGKFNIANIKRLVGAKVAAYFGSGLISILPFILVAALVMVIIGIMGGKSNDQLNLIGSKSLSPQVEQWRSLVETEATAQGMEAYISLILAIIQVETGGTGTRDIMQSSESAGYPRNYWQTEELSVRQGIKHLKNIVDMVKPFGLENDYKLLAQAYNFGSAFARYVASIGGEYNLDIAEKYSKDVVAPSLGNSTGEQYAYINETSKRLGKTYLYRNGGNFLYGELVGEYLGGGANVTGDFKVVVDELEKYLGWEYVWGGKNPSMGFDCSGFVSYGLAQIGITLPSYAAAQYDLTVPIDPSEAQPGDLVFFKGTYGGANHVSHVGFYIDSNTMLDSNGSGIGYHNFKDPYWAKHYAGIRRVVK